jgi:SAM-dependent methyltransferase
MKTTTRPGPPAASRWLLVTLALFLWFPRAALAPDGLRPPMKAVAQGEKSVAPGINDSWKSPDVEPLVQRLEAESREIWVNRELLAAVTGPLKGSAVADIGAGSGFMAEIFARLVGPRGSVYAVDISPHLMEMVRKRAEDGGISNLHTVVCTEKSVELPPASVDLVFICDTYHHFEYPSNTLASIHEALRPGGQIVVVDFERIEGVSRPWIIEHVRAGREVFIEEITGAGFELVAAHEVPQLEENYILRFRRRDP